MPCVACANLFFFSINSKPHEPGLWAQQESCIRAAVIQHSQIKVRATVCGGLFGLQGLCEVRVWEVAAVVCAAVCYGFCAAGEQCEWMYG